MIDCQNEGIRYHGQPTHRDGERWARVEYPDWYNDMSHGMAIAMIKLAEQRYEAEEARDMLARRCADQARQIADLLIMRAAFLAKDDDGATGDVFSAIATHQKQGAR